MVCVQDAEAGCVDGVDHDGDEVDLTGLMESIVDSDEEEDLAESIDVRSYLVVEMLNERVVYHHFSPLFTKATKSLSLI